MTQHTASSRTLSAQSLVATLHHLAAALRAGGEAEHLVSLLNRTLCELPGMEQFHLEPLSDQPNFSHDQLSVPLHGSAGQLGMMRVAANVMGEFTAGQMQVAGAVADLASVVLDNAFQARAASSSGDFLGLLLGDVALGVVCYRPDGSLLFANDSANRMLGRSAPVEWTHISQGMDPAGSGKAGDSFLVGGNGSLIQVSMRAPEAGGPGVVILTDISPRLSAFRETLAAAVYRSIVERRPLAVGVVSGDCGCDRLLKLLESSRAEFPQNVRLGPLDGKTAAIIAPEAESGTLWHGIRKIGRSAGGIVVSGGIASLVVAGDTPEALLARATDSLQALPTENVPGLLVVDRSLAVSETIALILRKGFSVTCANERDQSFGLLAERPFDGVIMELPMHKDSTEAGFVRRAMELQPSARSFFTTDLPGPWDLQELGLPSVPVFRKPFVVNEFRSRMREVFEQKAS